MDYQFIVGTKLFEGVTGEEADAWGHRRRHTHGGRSFTMQGSISDGWGCCWRAALIL